MAVASPFVPPVQERETINKTQVRDTYEDDVLYPLDDGKPMAETGQHYLQQVYCIESLRARYAQNAQAYVMGNNFIYFERYNKKAVVAPDCYVIFGVENRIRDIFQVWKEGGRTPSVVFEITSKSTRHKDINVKMALYEQALQVEEYFLFDPLGDYLKPPLQGYRLVNGKYERLPLADSRLHSEQLGLDLVIEGNFLRLYDPVTRQNLPTDDEKYAQMAEDRLQIERERTRTRQATQQAAEERQRAELAAQRAEQERQRAEQEARRADAAEAEMARLLAEIEALRKK